MVNYGGTILFNLLDVLVWIIMACIFYFDGREATCINECIALVFYENRLFIIKYTYFNE